MRYRNKKLIVLFTSLLRLGFTYPHSTFGSSLDTRADKFVWGAIGDSWGSGVSYNLFGKTDYDNNRDECLRLNHAYSVQVHKDNSWVPDGKEQDFHFAACSGARYVNMYDTPFNGYKQMDVIGKPTVITMQAGGNDAGFYLVASSCIFHDRDIDYGPDFPDPNSECAKEINKARNFIESGSGIYKYSKETIRDILGHPAVKDNKDLRLYSIGYAHFFDVRDDSKWCNDMSFAIKLEKRQKLTLELRKAINDLTERLNRKLQQVAEDFNDPRVGYIDVTAGFNGGRFCEKDHNLYDQYFGTKATLWNASPSGVIINDNGNYTVRDPTKEEFDNWVKTRRFTDDPDEVVDLSSITSGPQQGGQPGVALRPFHPKENGHKAIADAIIARLKKDFAPKEKPAPPPAAATKALTVMMENYIDEITNENTWTFWEGDPGKTPDGCNSKPVLDDQAAPEGVSAVSDPPFPDGEWKMKLYDQDCTYKSDGKGPGTLKCPGRDEIKCKEHADKKGGKDKTQDCIAIIYGIDYHPVTYCEW